MNDVTLADLRARTLDYADDTGSSFPVTVRVNDYINNAISELYDACVNAYEDYFLRSTTISIVGGTEEYNLSDDFYRLRKLYYLSGNRRYRVERFSVDEIGGYRTGPITAGTVEMWYVPQVTKLKTDAQRIDSIIHSLPYGWDDYVALHAAVILLKRSEDVEQAAMFSQERDRVLMRIINMLEPRDHGECLAIGDVSGRWTSVHTTLLHEERYFRYRVLGHKLHIVELEYLGV